MFHVSSSCSVQLIIGGSIGLARSTVAKAPPSPARAALRTIETFRRLLFDSRMRRRWKLLGGARCRAGRGVRRARARVVARARVLFECMLRRTVCVCLARARAGRRRGTLAAVHILTLNIDRPWLFALRHGLIEAQ